ncbi:MAG TPA: GntR family transcriptional regulator [Spirillospora sp.]|nr:GntR family transcriptional regulator [Spirillospora sp.]
MNHKRLRGAVKPLGSLSSQIYERIWHSIITGELPPGTRLVEMDIAAQMGTSQGPVRDALQRLERDGLVQRHARSATFVTSISTDEMYELFSIRSAIEAFAIRRTVQRIDGSQCAELQALVEAMRAAAQNDDMSALVNYDLEFHRLICEWSGNIALTQAWNPLYSQIQRFVAQTHKHYFSDLMEIADTHQPIVDVLVAKDIDRAEEIIKQHIMLIWSRIDTEGKTT